MQIKKKSRVLFKNSKNKRFEVCIICKKKRGTDNPFLLDVVSWFYETENMAFDIDVAFTFSTKVFTPENKTIKLTSNIPIHHLGTGAHLTWSLSLLEDFMVRGTHAQFVGEIRCEVGPGGGILHVGQTTY